MNQNKISINLIPVDAIETIIKAFQAYPIVALGEAHGLQEEHDFILSLIQHPSFTSIANDIVVEFGNALYQDIIDSYISGSLIPESELPQVWRNTINSPFAPWDAPIYERFFKAVRAINETRLPKQRIRILLGDPPIDWSIVSSKEDIRSFLDQRGIHFANIVESEVLKKRRKALLIIGSGHLGRKGNHIMDNTGGLIEQQCLGSMFVIIPHIGFGKLTDKLEPFLYSWPVPSIVQLKDTWIGDLDSSVHFGGVDFNAEGTILDGNSYEGVKLEDTADAYLYIGPIESLTLSNPNPEIYKDEAYLSELKRRYMIKTGRVLDVAVLIGNRPIKYIQSIG